MSAFYHDSAAALIVGGDMVAAAREARFSRVKPEDSFRCFMDTRVDRMVCGSAVPEESAEHASCIENYRSKYELD